MSGFPDVDPRYDTILLSKQIPREKWAEFKKWIKFYLCDSGSARSADTEKGRLVAEDANNANGGGVQSRNAEVIH